MEVFLKLLGGHVLVGAGDVAPVLVLLQQGGGGGLGGGLVEPLHGGGRHGVGVLTKVGLAQAPAKIYPCGVLLLGHLYVLKIISLSLGRYAT